MTIACGCPIEKKTYKEQKEFNADPDTAKWIRLYFKCPCAGENFDYPGVCMDRNGSIPAIQTSKFLKVITDLPEEPKSCTFDILKNNKLISDILQLKNRMEIDPKCLNETIPNCLYEGLILFEIKLAMAKNYFMKQKFEMMESERKAASTKNNLPNKKKF